MEIDLDKLRETTDRFRKDQQMDAESRATKQVEVKESIKKYEEEVAARVLRNTPHWCELAAGKGRNWAVIYKIENYKDARFSYGAPLGDRMTAFPVDDSTTNNIDVSRKVTLIYEGLKNAGLNPYFRHGHDGVGIKSWFDLVARW